MNGQLLEMWGRWLTAALQGQNQMDSFSSGWWLRSILDMSSLNKPSSLPGGVPSSFDPVPNMFEGWQQAWEAIFNMQQLCPGWMGMVPKEKYEALSDRAEELEKKVQEQAQTIERLRNLLSQTGGENNVVVNQLQDLIGQQSQQFKQLAQSMGDYIKSSTENMSAKK